MKTAKRALSALMVLAMLLSCMGATPFEAEDEQQPVATGEIVGTSETGEGTQTSGPAGETEAEAKDISVPVTTPASPTMPAETEEVKGYIKQKEDTPWTYGDVVADAEAAKDKFEFELYGEGSEDYGDPVLTFADQKNGLYTATVPTDAGEHYWVKATWTRKEADGSAPIERPAEFVIQQKGLRVTAADTKTYNGEEQILTLTKDNVTKADLVNGDTVESLTGAIKGTNKGEYTTVEGAKIKVVNADNEVTANYKPDYSGCKLTIDSKPIEVNLGVMAVEREYTGKPIVLNLNVDLGVSGQTLIQITTKCVDANTYVNEEIEIDDFKVNGGLKENYSPHFKGTLIIEPKKLSEKMVNVEPQPYTGSPIEVKPVVKDGEKTLQEGTDYENLTSASYENNTNAGTATVTVTGKGNYTGTAKVSFTIVQKSLTDEMIQPIAAVPYNGKAQEPAVTVKDGEKTLQEGTDYEKLTSASYENNTNAGTATVTVTGKGNYADTAKANFTIDPKSIEDATVTVTVASPSLEYNGKAQEPAVTVKDGETVLVAGKDYKELTSTSYENNTNAGTATVTVIGMGNYAGKNTTATFEITQKKIKVKAEATRPYAGKEITVPLTKNDITAEGLTKVDHIESLTAEMKGETVGPYTFDKEQSKAKIVIKNAADVDVTDNYDFSFEGTLTIVLADENAYTGKVTLEGWTYDGTAHAPSAEIDATAPAAIIEKYGTPVYHYYTDADAQDDDEIDAPKDAGTYFVQAVWNEDVGNKSLRVLKSNVLEYTIDEREITLQSASDEKVYDGTPLVRNQQTDVVPVEGTSFVTGESFVYDITGTITDVVDNTSKNNTFTYAAGPDTNVDNYKVTTEFGTLEITARPLEETDIQNWGTFADGFNNPEKDGFIYDKQEHKWDPKLQFENGNSELEDMNADADYTVTYSVDDFTNVTDIKVTITGINNFSGKLYREYKIDKRPITLQSASDEKVYDGTPLVRNQQTDVVPVEGTSFVTGESFVYDITGTITDVAENASKNNTFTYAAGPDTNVDNYKVTTEFGTLEITARPLEETDIRNWETFADGFTYDKQEHKWDPKLQFENGNSKLEDMNAGTDYTVTYSVDDFTNVTDITVTITGINNFSGELYREYKIVPREVTVSAVGTKQFGEKDATDVNPKDFTIVVTDDDPAVTDDDKNELVVAFANVVKGEEKLFEEQTAFTITAERDKGTDVEPQELPGKYAIKVTVEPKNVDAAKNYTVAPFTKAENAFEITTVPAFNVVLLGERQGEPDSYTAITSHTVGQVAYEIRANDGQDLIDNLKTYVDITLDVNADEVRDGAHVVPESEPDPVTPNIQKSIYRDETPEDKTGTFTIPAVSYDCNGYTWSSGLPAGTVLTAVVASKDNTGAQTISAGTTVAAVSGNFTIGVAPSEGKYVYPDESATDVILDGAATIKVRPQEEAAANVGTDDWIVLTVGGKVYHYSVDSYEELNGIAVPDRETRSLTLTLAQLKKLAGVTDEEGPAWFGGNPQGELAVSAELLDTVNHSPAVAGERNVAFDTGAVDSSQEDVGNREEASESIEMKILDSVSAAEPSAATTGVYGGSTPAFTAVSGMTGTITWTNATAWKNTPDKLPHSGDSFTVQYKDLVGNVVTHTVNVGRSAAVTPNTIYVEPVTGDTVPAKALKFYGDTNVWEAGVLMVGDEKYDIEPLPGGETYDNGTKQWECFVTLGDIDFPVGVPTTVSMAYEDLSGGEASILITYKDEAQTPVLGSEPVAGSQTLWGYVESSASVSVSVYHTDGSITQVPQNNIAVDQFGYFYVRLGSPLAEGEQVTISTRDFCGNQKFITVDVQTELRPNAAAEVLGANIVGELEDTDEIYHRFATPIDLGALAQKEDRSMTLPILAYKGIEIGEITFTLDDQGKLNVAYAIKSASFIPDGAKARMAAFAAKPTIDQLVLGEIPVVVDDLKAAATGTAPAVDVTAYRTDDGSYSGVIWLQAAFDIDMTEDNYVTRGGRDAHFYRWLTETLQTESVLGAVYTETTAYNDNVRYYNLYQTFENISRMS